MKYTIEATETGCIETLQLQDGSAYSKTHIRNEFGSSCKSKTFAEQMKNDGICEEIVEQVFDTFDALLPSHFMEIAELGC